MWPWHPDRRRLKLLGRAPEGPLRDFLAAPPADRAADYRELTFLALDLETSGLDPKADEILSVGFVTVAGGRLRLGTAAQLAVRPSRPIPAASAALHGILDDRAAQGLPLEEALDRVLAALKGKVLVAHHAPLELGFLSAACLKVYGLPLVAQSVDTLALERRRARRRSLELGEDAFRLDRCRERYGLPPYGAHQALTDALAVGELFLAIASHMAGEGRLLLKSLLTR